MGLKNKTELISEIIKLLDELNEILPDSEKFKLVKTNENGEEFSYY